MSSFPKRAVCVPKKLCLHTAPREACVHAGLPRGLWSSASQTHTLPGVRACVGDAAGGWLQAVRKLRCSPPVSSASGVAIWQGQRHHTASPATCNTCSPALAGENCTHTECLGGVRALHFCWACPGHGVLAVSALSELGPHCRPASAQPWPSCPLAQARAHRPRACGKPSPVLSLQTPTGPSWSPYTGPRAVSLGPTGPPISPYPAGSWPLPRSGCPPCHPTQQPARGGAHQRIRLWPRSQECTG